MCTTTTPLQYTNHESYVFIHVHRDKKHGSRITFKFDLNPVISIVLELRSSILGIPTSILTAFINYLILVGKGRSKGTRTFVVILHP